jgi:nucleosome binding factor SPN SPT16 subunit
MTNDQRRKEHQLSLAALRQQEGLNKYGDGNGDENSATKQLVFKKFESYKKETLIPRETKDLRVIVDRRNSTIILPIYGIPVPFHINTLKNVSKTEDRDNVFLRFNFVTPGQTMGKKDANTTVYNFWYFLTLILLAL